MQIPYRNPIIHDENPSTFEGDYQITERALENYKVVREKFGTTTVIIGDSKSYTVKDYQYMLDSGKVGMRFIPVSDYESITAPDGSQVKNFYLIDDYIRKSMGLGKDDQIYALITYMHPEQNRGTIIDLALKMDKAEFGITHAGAYLGYGRTSNAPMLYHDNRFGVDGGVDEKKYGYPVNLQIVSMDGVPQPVFNRNASLVDFCLNTGVMFPKNYKEAPFRAININTALMFYRDWLKRESYLVNDSTWFTYCAAHKTLVLTVAANLPHNLQSFVEVYGNEGKDIFKLFKTRYSNIVGPNPGFTQDMETVFEPLWKKQGFTAEQIKPFTKTEYDAYEEARIKKELPSFKGRKPLNPDQAVIWPPQTTPEVLYNFMRIYVDFIDAGAIVASQMLLGFMPVIIERLGINKLQYLFASMPIIEEMMYADARIYAPPMGTEYLISRYQELYAAFGGKKSDNAEGFLHSAIEGLILKIEKEFHNLDSFLESDPVPAALAAWSLIKVVKNWGDIIKAGSVPVETAYVDMMKIIDARVLKAEDYVVTDPDKVQYYTLPAIIHQICIGMHSAGKFVNVKEIGTVMDMCELELKK